MQHAGLTSRAHRWDTCAGEALLLSVGGGASDVDGAWYGYHEAAGSDVRLRSADLDSEESSRRRAEAEPTPAHNKPQNGEPESTTAQCAGQNDGDRLRLREERGNTNGLVAFRSVETWARLGERLRWSSGARSPSVSHGQGSG
eukprot:34492-Rhodomonas_salina.1